MNSLHSTLFRAQHVYTRSMVNGAIDASGKLWCHDSRCPSCKGLNVYGFSGPSPFTGLGVFAVCGLFPGLGSDLGSGPGSGPGPGLGLGLGPGPGVFAFSDPSVSLGLHRTGPCPSRPPHVGMNLLVKSIHPQMKQSDLDSNGTLGIEGYWQTYIK